METIRSRVVAGLDIHKDSVYLCIRNTCGAIIFENKYGVLTTDIRQMREDMQSYGVKEAAMESTGVYWIPIWNELTEAMDLKLVNPYFIKQLPGRKSDVKDAQWIAECLYKNLIKGSFVPSPLVQDLRKLSRRVSSLIEDRTYHCSKLDAALQRCGMRLSNYVSDTSGKSYQSVVRAIASGETNPDVLIKLIHGRTVNRHGQPTIIGALSGRFSDIDIEVIRQIVELIDFINKQIDECQKKLTQLCEEHFAEEYERIQTIPGIKERAATTIIAETGCEMDKFDTAADLVGWSGLKPRNDVSNGKYKSRRITHGNRFLRCMLVEVSWVVSRTKNTFFSNFKYRQCVVKRKNALKTQIAIARKLLVALWNMLRKKEDFVDFYKIQLLKQQQQANRTIALMERIATI